MITDWTVVVIIQFDTSNDAVEVSIQEWQSRDLDSIPGCALPIFCDSLFPVFFIGKRIFVIECQSL